MTTTLPLALVQVAPARDAIAVTADVAVIVVAAAVVFLALIAGLLLLRAHRFMGELRLTVRQNLGPVSDRARSISDNAEFITQVIRSDIEALDASVQAISERLTLASERMEERVEEFNALIEVEQGEAESLFLDTAATVRGVRESARSIAASAGRPGRIGASEAGGRPDPGGGPPSGRPPSEDSSPGGDEPMRAEASALDTEERDGVASPDG